MIPFIQNSRKCKLIYSDRKQLSGYLGTGGWIGKESSPKDMSKLLGMMVMFSMLVVVKVLGMWTYVTTLQIVTFNCVQFIKYQLYLNKARKKAHVFILKEAKLMRMTKISSNEFTEVCQKTKDKKQKNQSQKPKPLSVN